MIWYYDIELAVFNYLASHLPANAIRFTFNPTTINNNVKSDDFVMFFNYKHSKLFDSLHLRGVNVFPNYEFSYKIRNRAKQLRELDLITRYPLKRIYVDSFTGIPVIRSDYPIMKCGENHQGISKYKYPAKPKKILRNENIVYEEFVENHRAIRILFINDDIFVVELVNDNTWIKNDNPDQEIVHLWNTESEFIKNWIPDIENIIGDASLIKNFYNVPLIGIDYAVGSDIIGLLEVNDMVGIPSDDRAFNSFCNLLLEQSKLHLN